MPHTLQIEAIRQNQQRYDTSGDWRVDDTGRGFISVTGADLDDPETFLIAIHELVEMFLCQHRGISQDAVDQFDMAFEGDGEPGDDPAAPYRREHRQAMIVEHLVADMIGMPGYGKVE